MRAVESRKGDEMRRAEKKGGGDEERGEEKERRRNGEDMRGEKRSSYRLESQILSSRVQRYLQSRS